MTKTFVVLKAYLQGVQQCQDTNMHKVCTDLISVQTELSKKGSKDGIDGFGTRRKRSFAGFPLLEYWRPSVFEDLNSRFVVAHETSIGTPQQSLAKKTQAFGKACRPAAWKTTDVLIGIFRTKWRTCRICLETNTSTNTYSPASPNWSDSFFMLWKLPLQPGVGSASPQRNSRKQHPNKTSDKMVKNHSTTFTPKGPSSCRTLPRDVKRPAWTFQSVDPSYRNTNFHPTCPVYLFQIHSNPAGLVVIFGSLLLTHYEKIKRQEIQKDSCFGHSLVASNRAGFELHTNRWIHSNLKNATPIQSNRKSFSIRSELIENQHIFETTQWLIC